MSYALAALAAAVATAVPLATGPIAVTAESYPFMAARRAQELVDLEKLGYIEEEFFISGAANVYDWNVDASLSVRTANAPYTTRILLRRPANPARLSGTVVVEPLNNARAYDWAFVWAYSYGYFAEHGDAWIGVTHMPAAIAALKKFNATRYAPLSMSNPA